MMLNNGANWAKAGPGRFQDSHGATRSNNGHEIGSEWAYEAGDFCKSSSHPAWVDSKASWGQVGSQSSEKLAGLWLKGM